MRTAFCSLGAVFVKKSDSVQSPHFLNFLAENGQNDEIVGGPKGEGGERRL
jgi:hypothetical protein